MRALPALGLLALTACSQHPSGYPFPTPIHRVVVVVKENHTFDNYFAGFPGANTVATATLSNGTVIQRPAAPDGGLGQDPCHNHPCALTAWADGGMNGFDLSGGVQPADLTFAEYVQAQLPAYWSYAQNFVLADNYFTTILGPSTPNHLATIAAQAPIYDNPVCFADCDAGAGCMATSNTVIPAYDQDTCALKGNVRPCFDIPSVVDAFDGGLTWRGYGDLTLSGPNTSFNMIRSIGGNPATMASHVRASQQLLADLDAGDLPNFVHVDSVPTAFQEGPPEDPCPGENYTVDLVNAIMQGPYWNETAILITWDDWGGWFDHVPPAAEFCPGGNDFYSPGFRVPLLIISPYAKQGYVLHTAAEHASIPKLVEELFGLPMMHDRDPHARDAKVGSLLDAFDFTQPPRPPLILQHRSCP